MDKDGSGSIAVSTPWLSFQFDGRDVVLVVILLANLGYNIWNGAQHSSDHDLIYSSIMANTILVCQQIKEAQTTNRWCDNLMEKYRISPHQVLEKMK